MSQQVRLGDLLGTNDEEDFKSFDLTEVQEVLEELDVNTAIDLPHAEFLQQTALRGADIITEFLGKMVKTIGYLESKINSIKNKVSLEYVDPNGGRTTTDMKIWAGNSSAEVDAISIRLASAKASKIVLEKKYDILIKSHHHYKDIAAGLRKTILGYGSNTQEKTPEGYE